MTAIIDSDHKVIDCPHCKGKLNVEIERKPATVKISDDLPVTELETMIDKKIVEKLPKKEIEKEKEKEIVKEIEYPSFMPGEYCADGNCQLGGVHPNKNYKRKVQKRCKNCQQFAPKTAPRCAWCDNDEFEEMDDEDLENFGINLPKLEEHDHVH